MSKFGWSYPPGAANDPFAPYNQDYDDEHCVYCGALLPDDVTGFSEADEAAVDEGFCNAEHQTLFDKNGAREDWGKPGPMTQDEKDRYNDLSSRLQKWRIKRKDVAATLATVLEFLPDGDFEWEGEAGDENVYCCGSQDCTQQWHLIAHAEDFARKDGKLSIEIRTFDGDGWDGDGRYDEAEGDEPEDFEACVGWAFGTMRMNDYFHGWADYWLEATISGEDPCDQTLTAIASDKWATHCLDGSERMIKALEEM